MQLDRQPGPGIEMLPVGGLHLGRAALTFAHSGFLVQWRLRSASGRAQ